MYVYIYREREIYDTRLCYATRAVEKTPEYIHEAPRRFEQPRRFGGKGNDNDKTSSYNTNNTSVSICVLFMLCINNIICINI